MHKPPLIVVVVLAVTAVVVAACGSSTATPGTKILSSSTTQPVAHGTANIGVAGSLEGLVQTSLQPAFEKATGDHLVAKFEGSTDIAESILDNEFSPGVFVAVGKKAIKLLWPSRSHFVLTLATDPLVVAYSPSSPYAAELNQIRSGAKPLSDLFTLLETPGFRLGRTNPNDDPQGGYFELMFQLAEKELHLPAGTAAKILGTTGTSAAADVGSSSQVVSEDDLPTDLATATFDAGSEYLTEAKQYKLDYITLPKTLNFSDPSELSLYGTVSMNLIGNMVFQGELITLNETYVQPGKGVPRSAADAAADEAWLAFLVSPTGQSLLKKAGYVLEAPQLGLAPGFTSAKAVLPPPLLAGYNKLGGMVSTS